MFCVDKTWVIKLLLQGLYPSYTVVINKSYPQVGLIYSVAVRYT